MSTRKIKFIRIFNRWKNIKNGRRKQRWKVRTALYSNITIIDSYVAENPQKLSADKLEIIPEWKNFVQGDFYIERYLKRCAMFIQNNAVYGVLGLL